MHGLRGRARVPRRRWICRVPRIIVPAATRGWRRCGDRARGLSCPRALAWKHRELTGVCQVIENSSSMTSTGANSLGTMFPALHASGFVQTLQAPPAFRREEVLASVSKTRLFVGLQLRLQSSVLTNYVVQALAAQPTARTWAVIRFTPTGSKRRDPILPHINILLGTAFKRVASKSSWLKCAPALWYHWMWQGAREELGEIVL